MMANRLETVEARLAEMRALSRLIARINAGITLDEVLDHVYESFTNVIPYDRIGCALLEDGGAVLRSRWARSDTAAIKLKAGFCAPMKGSSLQGSIESGEPRILNDLERYLREHPGSKPTKLIVEEGVRSSLTCPLIVRGKPIGFLFFSSRETDTYRDAHVDVFLQIANQLSTTIEKSRLYDKLLELNESKNRFLGIAAHDLRQPLTIIIGFAGLLEEMIARNPPQECRTAVKKISASARGMLVLINDLLDVSAIESGKLRLDPRPIDFGAFLAETVEKYGIMAGAKSIKLEYEAVNALPGMNVDPERIEQVLSNLISNAVKFSHSGTKITVRGERRDGEVRVSVSDQGQGIPKDDLPKLFKEFSRTRVQPTANEKSTGLGLAIIKKLVAAHGGRIWVESEEGKGSVFTFSLPVKSEEEL